MRRGAANLLVVVILLSALAVVAAAILLVAWFVVGGGFALIYAAMALAVVSMVLLWAARWMGSTPAPPLPEAPDPLVVDRPVRARAPHEPRAGGLTADDEAVDDEVLDLTSAFPIKDYDHLWVTQIVPLLAELDLDELAMVEARERGGRHRGGVLDAVEAERAERDGDQAWAEPGWSDPDWSDPDWSDPSWGGNADWSEPEAEPAVVDLDAPTGDAVVIDPVKVDPMGIDTAAVAAETTAHDEGIEAGRVRTFLGRPAGPITVRRG